MKTNLSLIIISSLTILSCGNSLSTDYAQSQPTYEETKLSLEETEKRFPLQFLSTNGTYRKNLIGEWVLEGTISNSASVVTYKDVVITIMYFSKTKTLIGKENKIIYEFFKPGTTKKFKIKVGGFSGTESIGWEVGNATATNK